MGHPRILIDRDAIVVNGRTVPMAEVVGAAAEQQGGAVLWPALVGAVAGVGVIPALIAVLGHTGSPHAEQWLYLGLFVAAAALFAAIGKLLFSEDRYCLMLDTVRGPRCVLVSDDPQLIISLVAQVNELRAPGPTALVEVQSKPVLQALP